MEIEASDQTTSDQQEDNDAGRIIPRRASSCPIPEDLMEDILSRLPVKHLARFLCVSKFWASKIRSPSFRKSFMTRSLTQPHLLFIASMRGRDTKLAFFSSSTAPRDDADDGGESSSLVASHIATFPGYGHELIAYQSVSGLVLLELVGNRFVICNPNLRRLKALPEIGAEVKGQNTEGFIGYDPVEDRYKVLWVTSPEVFNVGQTLGQQIRVFTLGDETWRRIETFPPPPPPLHVPSTYGICINGVLYYKAWSGNKKHGMGQDVVVCFDVRSETFDTIQLPPANRNFLSTLVNHKGKLAVVCHNIMGIAAIGEYTVSRIEFCVLEDAEKREWSMKTFVLPPTWWEYAQNKEWPIKVSVTDAGELVLVWRELHDPLFVLYYSPETNRLRKVEVKGIADQDLGLDDVYVKTYIKASQDHVESLMLL